MLGGNSFRKCEYLQRSVSTTHVDVKFEDTIHVTHKQGEFLSNNKYKMHLISSPDDVLTGSRMQILQADGDADIMIVSTAIGDHTDLLILLIVLAPPNNLLKMIIHIKSNQQEIIHCIQIFNV